MAGQIAELAHRTLRRDFRRINTREAKVVLVDAASQVLPPFGAKLGEKAKSALEELGVEVQLGAMVVDVDEWGIDVQDKDGSRRRIEATTKVWAAGVQASPLGKVLGEQTGAALDRAGRISVNPDLTLPGHPEVFVVGDMINLDHLPGVAQVAIQGAKYAAKEINARLSDGEAPQKPFKYFDKGSMATISRFRAVAMVGRLRITGFIAWLMWLGVHLVYLTGFKNRVGALGHWAVSFLGRGRSERTATEQQIFARAALQRLKGGASDLVSSPGDYEATRDLLEASRRAELEARAAEEARLTDSGERGVHQDEPACAPLTRTDRAQSSTMWTAASSALAPAPSMPTSSPTRSFSSSGPSPSSSSTSRPARSVPTSPPTSSVSSAASAYGSGSGSSCARRWSRVSPSSSSSGVLP